MSQVLFILLMFMESISRLLVIHKVEERRCTLHTEKQRGRTPYASLFSIHLWIPRVLIVQRGKGHHNRTQTRPFVSLPERLLRPGEKGRQLSPSLRLPRCFAVPSGWGKKRPSKLGCGRGGASTASLYAMVLCNFFWK
jgi:hypothetical protein